MFNLSKTSLTILTALLIGSAACDAAASEKPSTGRTDQSVQTARPRQKLASGLYLVLRTADDTKDLKQIGDSEIMLINDFHFLEPAEREPVKYLVLQTKPFVPFVLGADPTEDLEAGGKPRLQLQLAEGRTKPLEDFTRAHLGDTVAIVIDGDVVTTHKVKSVITGGRLQITRCTQHGCRTLYSKLLQKHE